MKKLLFSAFMGLFLIMVSSPLVAQPLSTSVQSLQVMIDARYNHASITHASLNGDFINIALYTTWDPMADMIKSVTFKHIPTDTSYVARIPCMSPSWATWGNSAYHLWIGHTKNNMLGKWKAVVRFTDESIPKEVYKLTVDDLAIPPKVEGVRITLNEDGTTTVSWRASCGTPDYPSFSGGYRVRIFNWSAEMVAEVSSFTYNPSKNMIGFTIPAEYSGLRARLENRLFGYGKRLDYYGEGTTFCRTSLWVQIP